ncbi:MAG: glutathione S-transferase [Myxococcota bacterium]
MPRYEVVYFDIRGRAEPIRLLLALAGQAFDDTRHAFDAWPVHKPTTPLGQAPVLVERDGTTELRIPQSQAILRHLARVHGLYGATEAEHVACDVVVETCGDLRQALAPLRFGPGANDPVAKQKFLTEALPDHLGRMRRLLAAGPKSGWFVAEAPTWADITAFDTVEVLHGFEASSLADAPELLAFADRMRAVPQIAAYLTARAAANR